MTGRTRRVVRGGLFTLLVGATVAVAVVTARHGMVSPSAPAIPPVDDWAARGVRFAHDGAHDAKLRVAAASVTSAPVRFGVFSLGFVQRLEATDVDIGIDLGSAREPRDLGVDLTTALGAVAGPGTHGKHFTSGHIDGVVVRVAAPDAPAFELRAAHCDVRASRHRRVVFRDQVVVRVRSLELWFRSLVYDVAARRFVRADGSGAARERGSSRSPDLELVNDALRELVRPPA